MKSYIQGLITGGVLVFTSLVLIGAQEKSPNIYVTEKEFYEIIDAVINDQNFDKKEGWERGMRGLAFSHSQSTSSNVL